MYVDVCVYMYTFSVINIIDYNNKVFFIKN